VERKARDYIGLSDGKIQAVLILDLHYPNLTKAWVSLLVANGPPDYLIHNHVLYFDGNLDQQPAGQVGFYLSDFAGLASLPAAYCRPSAAELDAGITRNPTVILTYDKLRAIFRWARHVHDPAKFTIEVGDEPQNSRLDARRDAAEKDRELERQRRELEQKDSELERKDSELEQLRAELKRRPAEQRMVGGLRGGTACVAEERMVMERRRAERLSEDEYGESTPLRRKNP